MVTTAVKVGRTIAQERTVPDAVEDKAIYLQIKKDYFNLSEDLFLGVHVIVVEGRVHLTGSVATPDMRIDALRIAWQTKGVKEVLNEVKVTKKSAVGNVVQDTSLNTQVKTALFFAKGVQSVNYMSDVKDGTVYLMGIAQDSDELQRAAGAAGRVKGVKKVVSYVRMKDGPSRQRQAND